MRCFRLTDLVASKKQKNERRRAILRFSDLFTTPGSTSPHEGS
jgi:hypothetical protein